MRRTAANGYAGDHPKIRREWEPLVKAGGVCCSRCGQPIVDGKVRLRNGRVISNWALDHDDHDRTQYRGPSHFLCNARAAARKVNALKHRRSVSPAGVFGPLSS